MKRRRHKGMQNRYGERRIRYRRTQSGWPWFFTGIMFLILTGLLLFWNKDTRGYDSIDEKKADVGNAAEISDGNVPGEDKGQAKESVFLKNLDDMPAGTVLDSGEIDPERLSEYFTVDEIGDEVRQYIEGRSYVKNDHIQLDELRYLKLLHYNYDHEPQVGELIVNKKIAGDCKEVFEELFAEEYEIASMYLIDKFWTGDSVDSDTNSIENNNTSAFNYRVVPGTDRLSNHAAGFAIDINPLQNPYVKYDSDGNFAKYYKDMEKYTDRKKKGEHMITHEDTCYKVFEKHGFIWGGDWNDSKDYQHFEKEQ